MIWRFPILALAWGSPAIFWLWSWAEFDDRFRLRWWCMLPWLALVGGWSFVTYAGVTHAVWPFAAAGRAFELLLPLLTLALAAGAAGHILATWRGDLVGGRRSLRWWVLMAIVIDIAVISTADLVPGIRLPGLWPGAVADTAAQCGLAILVSWYLLRIDRSERAAALLPASADAIGDDMPSLLTASAPSPGRRVPGRDFTPALLHRLDHLMSSERAYREEGLTIGVLAGRLRVPEYRLRQAINEGLGHRNFNVFLNRYRIEEAKAALSSLDQTEVPVLTIALDAGFQSVGPFNRAFKADTGMTPTEYRRAFLAKALKSPADSEIGKAV